RELGRPLICDEVFADYGWAPDQPFTTVAGEPDLLAFSLSGLSKLCGLPQLKLGWMVVAGPPAARAAALARLEVIGDTYLSVATPVQLAAPRLLATRRALQAQIHRRLEANRLVLAAALAGGSCRLLESQGGWYAVIGLPATRSEEEWTLELLERDAVLVHPGYFFDFADEPYAVVSLLTPERHFSEGVARIAQRTAE